MSLNLLGVFFQTNKKIMVLVEGELFTPKEIQSRDLSPRLYSLCLNDIPW